MSHEQRSPPAAEATDQYAPVRGVDERRQTHAGFRRLTSTAMQQIQGGIAIAAHRDAPIKSPGRIEYPNLTFYVPEPD